MRMSKRGGVMIGDGYSTYADSMLMTMSKNDLIHTIRLLEKNLRNAEEVNNRQYELLVKATESSCGAASSCAMVCEVE